MDQYLLIDGKNLLFRAGHASRNLKTSDGRYSGAIHGFIRMLTHRRVMHQDAEFVVLWEREQQRTYRHRLFAGYKDRSKPEGMDSVTSGIRDQIEGVKNFCKAVGMRWIEVPKLEADDLAGLLSRHLSKLGHETLLLSGDQDWWQLAPIPNVSVICERAGVDEPIITDERVQERFGCKANQLLKFRPFIGDSSDKIPPVKPRFLKKHALQLLAAGVDPKKDLSEQPEAVQKFVGIAEIWPNYVRNYRLMKIARTPAECEMSDEWWEHVLDVVFGDRPQRVYKDMVAVLAKWELEDALSRRDFLYRLAHHFE